nr:MAG TPA: hypothetical protein [Caudoviricetes sp.]
MFFSKKILSSGSLSTLAIFFATITFGTLVPFSYCDIVS